MIVPFGMIVHVLAIGIPGNYTGFPSGSNSVGAETFRFCAARNKGATCTVVFVVLSSIDHKSESVLMPVKAAVISSGRTSMLEMFSLFISSI